jgi:orotate phosphoribosyltransferase
VPDRQAVTGKNVLLIDDILTTGATVRSVAQVLVRAGAASVWVATLSRARQVFDYGHSDTGLRQEASYSHESDQQADAGREAERDQPSF